VYTKNVQPFQGWLQKTRSAPQVSPAAIHVQSFQDWQIVFVSEPQMFLEDSPRGNGKRVGVTQRKIFGCGWAALESLFSTSMFFAWILAEGRSLSPRERELGCGWAALGYYTQGKGVHISVFSVLLAVMSDRCPQLKVYTVGHSKPERFKTIAESQHLADIICEACRGQAGKHVAIPPVK